jgi:hypothetical protein
MKKSELKEYLKNEILRMNEASQEDVDLQKDLNAELEKTKELTADMKENKVTKTEFKEYLRNEILREINEQEEDIEDIDVDLEPTETQDMEDMGGLDDLGGADSDEVGQISDDLVDLARKAKNAGQIELANQILNSAKFANKTKLKDIEKEV